MTPWIPDLQAAQAGDARAFERLVARFGAGARAFALAWLGDAARADEITQEALLHVWQHLPEVRDPLAFPAWLRRVVRKFADRVTRRAALPLVSLEAANGLAAGEDAEAILARRGLDEALQIALAELPEPERLAIALYHLAGWPVAEVAAALSTTPAAVKKRLQRARGRLRAQVIAMLDHAQPLPLDAHVQRAVRFFVAARQGDVTTVQAALAEDPGLVSAPQPGAAGYKAMGGPGDGTALHMATRRGAEAVVRALLAAGAAPNGPDHAGHHPLHIAALTRRPAIARALLDAGADPNAEGPARLTPLHVARIRGADEVAHALLDAGADAAARDRGGLTPADWAALPPPALPPVTGGVLWTGIRAIDRFAPLPVGGVARLKGAHGVGMMTLLAELLWRHAERTGRVGTYLPWMERVYGEDDVQAWLHDLGVAHVTQTRPEDLGPHDLVVVDHVIWRQAGHPTYGGATVVVYEGWEAGLDPDDLPPWPEVDATWTLDPALAARQIWPAINPDLSHGLAEAQQPAPTDAGALAEVIRQPFFVAQAHTGWPGQAR